MRIVKHDPILVKFTFLKSLRKVVRNMFQLAQFGDFFIKVGTPSLGIKHCISSHSRSEMFLNNWCPNNKAHLSSGILQKRKDNFFPSSNIIFLAKDHNSCVQFCLFSERKHCFAFANRPLGLTKAC